MAEFKLFEQPTRVVQSNTYGSYVVRRVGRLDPMRPNIDDAWSEWQESGHPRAYFRGSCQLVSSGAERVWDVYVPLIEDNTTWSAKGTKLEADCVKHRIRVPRELPVVVASEVVMEWRALSVNYID